MKRQREENSSSSSLDSSSSDLSLPSSTNSPSSSFLLSSTSLMMNQDISSHGYFRDGDIVPTTTTTTTIPLSPSPSCWTPDEDGYLGQEQDDDGYVMVQEQELINNINNQSTTTSSLQPIILSPSSARPHSLPPSHISSSTYQNDFAFFSNSPTTPSIHSHSSSQSPTQSQSSQSSSPSLFRNESISVVSRVLAQTPLESYQWNNRFQEIYNDYYRLRGTIPELFEEFIKVAVEMGKTIISERSLPPERRTIKPVGQRGEMGFAGGEKCFANGIFMKYATDFYGLYGGNDEGAIKAAGAELRAMNAYFGLGRRVGLSFPLMCLVDYRGWRLVASSILAINETTLVYGSRDAGFTVHASDLEMNSRMQTALTALNLKGHTVKGKKPGSQPVLLYGPTDLEGHKGVDGKYYVIDAARTFPPCTPTRVKGVHLYRLMRPEFVKKHSKPLCSDNFSPWASAEDTSEGVEATKLLEKTLIPQYASLLRDSYLLFQKEKKKEEEEGSSSAGHLSSSPSLPPSSIFGSPTSFASSTGLLFLDHYQFRNDLHKQGINLRYLGIILELTTLPELRKHILSIIVARTIKNLLKREMRKQLPSSESISSSLTPSSAATSSSSCSSSPSPSLSSSGYHKDDEQHYRVFVTTFFNNIFFSSPSSYSESKSKSSSLHRTPFEPLMESPPNPSKSLSTSTDCSSASTSSPQIQHYSALLNTHCSCPGGAGFWDCLPLLMREWFIFTGRPPNKTGMGSEEGTRNTGAGTGTATGASLEQLCEEYYEMLLDRMAPLFQMVQELTSVIWSINANMKVHHRYCSILSRKTPTSTPPSNPLHRSKGGTSSVRKSSSNNSVSSSSVSMNMQLEGEKVALDESDLVEIAVKVKKMPTWSSPRDFLFNSLESSQSELELDTQSSSSQSQHQEHQQTGHVQEGGIGGSGARVSQTVMIPYGDIQLSVILEEGITGIIWKALWKEKEVAVTHYHSRKLFASFVRVADELYHLDHPNIVKLYGICSEGIHRCAVTEYVPDGTLDSFIEDEDNVLDWSLRYRIAAQIARAMKYLHSRQPPLIHSNLSGSNILVNKADGFNVSLNVVRITRDVKTAASNSCAWVPPEIIAGDEWTECSDVYCYGVILWQLMTREDPYEESYQGDRDFPADCPADFWTLVRECLAEDPASRPPFHHLLSLLESHSHIFN